MPIPPPENGLHTVKDGEWVASIADEYGYTEWEKEVWNHGKNSELKKLRVDPHVLKPDDQLHIPPFEPKWEKCPTTKKHTFELNTPTEVLRVQFKDPQGEPIKDVEYFLTIDRRSGRPFKQKNKKTNGEGRIEEPIPSDAVAGLIRIPDAGIESNLDFGYLSPLKEDNAQESVRGAAQRLFGLGFLAKENVPEDNTLTPEVISAVESFCHREKIELKNTNQVQAAPAGNSASEDEKGESDLMDTPKESSQPTPRRAEDVLVPDALKKIKELFGT
jgi:hypothetical protein